VDNPTNPAFLRMFAFLLLKHTFSMPNPRSRNSRDDKSKGEKSPRNSFNDRKPPFKSKSTDTFKKDRDTDKKSFNRDHDRPVRTDRKDGVDARPGKSFGRAGSSGTPRKFDRNEKKPFGTTTKRQFNKEAGETEERPRFNRTSGKKSSGSFDRGYQKTYSPRKSGAEKLGGKGPKRPMAPTKDDGLIRLNRYISNAGICSRRKADELIAAGVVSVNGSVVSELGFKVDPAKDVIRYNGETLKREKMVYVLLNKPKDYITTTDDPQERRTVMQLVEKASKERIYPVGRLDRNTTGLLLLTNDGDLADKLSHPKNNITKIYQAELNKSLSQGDLNKIAFGLELEDGFIKPDEISYVQGATKREVGIQIHSGKNRIVRRIFEHLGYDVVKLDRVVYANLTKKDLPRGRWRFLDEKEIIQLKHLIK
jgi:23S rRNA pseudouridine2605 synthase